VSELLTANITHVPPSLTSTRFLPSVGAAVPTNLVPAVGEASVNTVSPAQLARM
jgi:hypothetical protein